MKNPLAIIGNPPHHDEIYHTLFKYIDNVFPDFMPLNKNPDGTVVETEDSITEDLVDYLEARQDFLKLPPRFRFTYQSQGKADIGVKSGRDYITENRKAFCWIEAKRLPTPKKQNRDEREYVFVNQEKINGKKKYHGNGGIQRFKENKHASGLPCSMMIGYIQDNDITYWLNKINIWIVELAKKYPAFWNKKDCLIEYLGKRDRFVSVHIRKSIKGIEIKPIILYHFWKYLPRTHTNAPKEKIAQ